MSGIHPLYVLFAALGLATGLWSLHQRAPEATRWILAAAGAGLVIRAAVLSGREREEREGARAVPHAELRKRDFRVYESWLKENVRGQDAAVERVGTAIERGLELSAPGRGLGSFLLVGPTGTGKTFLSLMTAKVLTPEAEPVLLRMNQYATREDAKLLMGGHGAPGTLTGPVLEDPLRVVVLDEIDKCHPDVRHALLDALDAGRCRDKESGRLVDFSGCVFFATCNAGVEGLRRLAGKSGSEWAGRARDVLAQDAGFDKAFLARFTEIVLMDSLAPVHVAEIACLQMAKHCRSQGVELAWVAPELVGLIVRRNEEFGEYGVRQLARCVASVIDEPLELARREGMRVVRLRLDEREQGARLELRA